MGPVVGLLGTTLRGPPRLRGNLIGMDATGPIALSKGLVRHIWKARSVTIGGTAPGEGNTIAINGAGSGLGGLHGFGTARAHDPRQLHLRQAGLRYRAWQSTAEGATRRHRATPTRPTIQNYPERRPRSTPGAPPTILGCFDSAPSMSYNVDFYRTRRARPSPATSRGPDLPRRGSGHDRRNRNATIDASLPAVAIAAGEPVARPRPTRPERRRSSRRGILFLRLIRSAPAPDGHRHDLGTFAAGATVTIGGQPATTSSASTRHTINANTPSLAPGAANDIVVRTPTPRAGHSSRAGSRTSSTTPATVSTPSSRTLVSNAITVGVGGGNYGIDSPARQQMAVFLLKARHGLCYTPPPCTGIFADVPCPSDVRALDRAAGGRGHHGRLRRWRLTARSPVRRDQMAVFLLKAEHGPPTPAALHRRLRRRPLPSTFANWIEQLAAENITGGCGGGNYCPQSNNTRGQMAVFLVKTFGLARVGSSGDHRLSSPR